MKKVTSLLFVFLAIYSNSTEAVSQPIGSEAIIKALLPKPSQLLTRTLRGRSLVRSYRPFRGTGRGIGIEGGKVQPQKPPSINLQVHFEFNSSSLTNDAILTIDTLGKALADKRLAQMRFKIIGHTDAVGEGAANMVLSRKRASTVVARLLQFHHIPPQRLISEGRGESQLVDPSYPEAAINRRVQIINLGNLVN